MSQSSSLSDLEGRLSPFGEDQEEGLPRLSPDPVNLNLLGLERSATGELVLREEERYSGHLRDILAQIVLLGSTGRTCARILPTARTAARSGCARCGVGAARLGSLLFRRRRESEKAARCQGRGESAGVDRVLIRTRPRPRIRQSTSRMPTVNNIHPWDTTGQMQKDASMFNKFK